VGGSKVEVPLHFMDGDYETNIRPTPVDREFHRRGMGVFMNPCAIPPVEDYTKRQNYEIRKSAYDKFQQAEQDFANKKKNEVTSTFIHEVGHFIEADPDIQKMAQLFKAYRCGTAKPQQYNKMELFKGAGYSDDEKGVEDDFGKAFDRSSAFYIGKEYASGSTEILSMGLQKLYDDPKTFLEKDPEYAHFCINMVAHYRDKKEKERT
jgi:hypothetical protein